MTGNNSSEWGNVKDLPGLDFSNVALDLDKEGFWKNSKVHDIDSLLGRDWCAASGSCVCRVCFCLQLRIVRSGGLCDSKQPFPETVEEVHDLQNVLIVLNLQWATCVR